ncbi:sulfatase [Brevifollis gellanilyticus]|nr:sulfatase [Brevifollis gellanilyticus]
MSNRPAQSIMNARALLCCLSVFVSIFFISSSASSAQMNVVLILADDLGSSDLRCYGSDLHETPNLDKLASEGMRFTQNYAACTVCSPTRAALMTGKYPARLHITDWIPGRMPENPKLLTPDWTRYLPSEEVTLAEAFKAAGYTTASIGKWHLGEGEHSPENQGFDVNIAGTNEGAPPSYIAPWKISTLSEGKEGDYLTDRLGEEAAAYVARNKDNPFFLYLPHYAVHTPIQARADLLKKYEGKIKAGLMHSNPGYAAMMESMDTAVGRVLAALEEHKLTDRTIVIFTSDNGGRVPTTANKSLRVGKGSAYEGGLRVPLIVRWPGVTKPGSTSDTPTITMDLFPTLLDMTSVQPVNSTSATGASGRDGLSLLPLLRGEGTLNRSELFWHYPHHQHYQLGGSMPFGVVRSGNFKLIEFYNDMHVELYDLQNDLGEQHDLSASQPEKAAELRERLHQWREQVDAQMPLPNPSYDPSAPEHIPEPVKGKKKKKKEA